MAYEYPGDGSLDYYPCRYGTSRLLFRGPRRDLVPPYVAVLGGTETYGKFVPEPFPTLVEAQTGVRMINMGLVNAGVDAFLKDADALGIAERARLAVVQIMGAQNLSNRFYSVHPRRNDRFVAATPLLRSIFREIDFTEFHFTRHMLRQLQARSPDRFEVVADELRAVWVRQMRGLLRELHGRTVLLWIGPRPPPAPGRRADLEREPLLVDRDMIAAVRPLAKDYLEVVLSPEAVDRATEGMVLGPLDMPVANGLPGPAAHREVAAGLSRVLTGPA